MMEETQEWGEFSDWLDAINRNIEASHEQTNDPDWSVHDWLDAMSNWMQALKDAPMTTWEQELDVRGFESDYRPEDSDRRIHTKLWQLVEALAGMRVFLTNSDHLSDRCLYRRLICRYLKQPVIMVPFESGAGCVIDVVGSETQDDPDAWLRYYASNHERMEWAKQNVGKPLPPSQEAKYPRESRLPKPFP